MNNNYTLEILVNGKPIKKFGHNSKSYVEARNGAEYQIRIKNNTSKRVLAVTTIDSLNVLDGKVDSEAGYVINGYDSLIIHGWRTDDNTVNSFKFSNKTKSYAAKSEEAKGNTSNCGVIGLKIISEKEKRPITIIEHRWYEEKWPFRYRDFDRYTDPYYSPYYTWCGTNDTSNSILSGEVRCASVNYSSVQETEPFSMGTEFSTKEIESKVHTVEFEKGEVVHVQEIYYDSLEGLKKLGVPVDKAVEVVFPQAFPSRYCKKPF